MKDHDDDSGSDGRQSGSDRKERDPSVAERWMHRVLDGEATAAESDDLTRHLAGSAGAAADFAELEEISALFREAPRAEVPPDFADQVVRRVFETPFRTEVWPRLLPVIRRLSAAAAVLGLVSLLSTSLVARNAPAVLFPPQDPVGVSPLRPALGELGHAILAGGAEQTSDLLRAFTLSAEGGGGGEPESPEEENR